LVAVATSKASKVEGANDPDILVVEQLDVVRTCCGEAIPVVDPQGVCDPRVDVPYVCCGTEEAAEFHTVDVVTTDLDSIGFPSFTVG
jgi:hypothetical protein